MRDSVGSAFKSFNTQFEGYLTFMYGDVKNLVTTGMGNLIDPIGAALSLPWVNTDGSASTQQEITDAWNAVKARTDLTSHGGGAYKGVTSIRLTDAGIDQLILNRLKSNESTLRFSYPDYDNWPADAQMAILSMAWAMGPAFEFPTFKQHVNAGPPDFTSAATDSQMDATGNPGLVPRNNANKQLFLNAADVLKYKADPDKLYYPNPVPQTGTTTTAAPASTTTAAPATTTTAAPATTTTAAASTTTTAAPQTTTSAPPPTTTTAAPAATTSAAPAAPAAPAASTTAAPAATTSAAPAPAASTTAAPAATTSAAPASPAASTTATPAATTSAPPAAPAASTTSAPAETTSAAPASPAASTTSAPAETTSAAPASPAATTTAAPAATTSAAPAESTTSAPAESTSAAPASSTTAAPEESTTAAPPSSTTAEPGASTTAGGDENDTASSSGGGEAAAGGGDAAGCPPTVTGSITLDPDDGSEQNPQSYQVSESVKLKLKWSSNNADSVDIAGLGAGLAASGEQDIPTAEANYSITATGKTGTSDPFDIEVHTHKDGEVVSAHVDLGADVAAVISFTANKDNAVISSAMVGDTITLIAIVSDATETVKLNGADAELTELPNGQKQAQVDVTIDDKSDGNFDCQALKGGKVEQEFPQHVDIVPAPTTSTTSAPTTTAAPGTSTTEAAAAATTTAAPAATTTGAPETTTVAPAAPPESATTPPTTSTQSAEVSAAPDETTTASAEVSAAPGETTTASAEVSAAPDETTTASAEVSAAPESTTAAPAAPAAPSTTTAAPATTTTAAPATTTTAAPATTTTAAPATTTTAAPATTTTAAPATTTTAAPATTTTADSSLTPSGADWVNKFPTKSAVTDLTASFQAAVNKFLAALKDAGASVEISATYRPPERGYLMHYAYTIAKEGADPQTIPAKAGVNIRWAHKAADGSYDKAGSVAGAAAMNSGYGTAFKPSLTSRHFEHRAIDMTISWSGTLNITDGNGTKVAIASSPKTGRNTDLATVGASYGVHKLVKDPPHWSDDGH